MRRKNRKSETSDGFNLKKCLYIAGSILAVAIIAFVITFFSYGNKLEQDETSLAKFNTTNDEYNETTEETSSDFGKTVNEIEEDMLDLNITANVINDTETNDVVQTNTNETTNTTKTDTTQNKTDTNTTKYAINTSSTENVISKDTKKTESKQNVNQEKVQVKDPTFKQPVKGEVIKEFAKDKLVYSNTLRRMGYT